MGLWREAEYRQFPLASPGAGRVLPPALWPGCGTDLSVSAVLLLAFAASEEVGLSATCLGHLVLPDRLFRHSLPDLLQLVTGHFLPRREHSYISPASPPTATTLLQHRDAMAGWEDQGDG